MFTARRYANAIGKEVHLTFLTSSSWILLLWMVYPICWGVSEGGNVIHSDSEFIFYGILDCCLIPISSAILLRGHRGIDPRRLGLYMREYDDPIPGYNSIVKEERA
jgi:bacteriorhodopsin